MIRRDQYILKACSGKRVLHIGCCDTPLMVERIRRNELLHLKLLSVARPVHGLDCSSPDIAVLQEQYYVKNVVAGNAERVADYFRGMKFEVIVAGELLEHLDNPGSFLDSSGMLLEPDGIFIVTVPNGVAFRRGINSLLRRESVHDGHNCYFSKKTIARFLEHHNFVIEKIHGYRIVDRQFLLAFVSDAIAGIFSEFACEGILAVARLHAACTKDSTPRRKKKVFDDIRSIQKAIAY